MSTRNQEPEAEPLLRTGVAGLDDVLGGGLIPGRLYLLEGAPGAGKTTVAMQFLTEGVRLGEPVLYVTLSETVQELHGVARSHGWTLAGIELREMLPSVTALEADEQHTMFHPSELELSETTLKILEEVSRIVPKRVVFDSLSELRLLAGNSLRYRRQILALKQYFAGRQCTVVLLDDMTAVEHDLQVQSIAHAVVRLEQVHSDYGATRRRLVVTKYRGQAYRDGFHDYKIVRGGLEVYPRLVAAEHTPPLRQEQVGTGLPAFDELLCGGIHRGTSTLLVGAPGTGKSTLALQVAVAAVQRGEVASLYLFDESIATLRTRSLGLGLELEPMLASGRLRLRQVNPAELSPGEFIHLLREAAVRDAASVIVIDSLNGYLNAMPDERFLVVQLHELLRFLNQAGVMTILVSAQQGLIGGPMQSPVDASYLADSVVLLRYFEAEGEVRQAISVVKKRSGVHERSIRRLQFSREGIVIGEPLRDYRGVLTGGAGADGAAVVRLALNPRSMPEPSDRASSSNAAGSASDDRDIRLGQRVLMRLATAKDATITQAVLARAGLVGIVCVDADQMREELARGAGVLMLSEEALAAPGIEALTEALLQQPPWSDVPVLVLAREGAGSQAIERVMGALPNLAVVERPVRVAPLVSALRSMLRARRRQFELRALLEGLQEADRRKTEFLATLAHELRNPLAPISTALQALSHERADPAQAPRLHAMMRRQLDHMVRLIDDLMEASRINRGKVDLRPESLNLAPVLEAAVELSRPMIQARGHRLSVELPAEALRLQGDTVRLTQVFSNLLNNAAKYTPPGDGRILLRARAEGGEAVVQVADNGCGLAPETLESIFEMFVQVGGVTRSVHGGLGIGLTLAKSLVELHGGSVHAESRGLGQGATFTVRLPLGPSADRHAADHDRPAGVPV